MRKILIGYLLLFSFFNLIGQKYSYSIDLEPIIISELGGLQSYAVGTYQEEWLIVGGRLDGLHRRQPFASFSADGNNNQIIVVNPITKEVWKQNIDFLPSNLKEQLSSSNIQFYQDDEHLLLIGGYAYSPSQDDHITFPYLTVLNIANIIDKVKSKSLSVDDFQQLENEEFRVTGGRLAKINDTFHLVGGHKFMGRYNPMGPDHGPGFEQEYTNEIRKFTLSDEDELELQMLLPFHDEMHLHRRDYNLVPQIRNAQYGLMLFSGVFQTAADVPWLYPIRISEDSYEPVESFSQYFNHYHCATLPIYNQGNAEMHTLFFGGIAQFYLDNNILVQDNDVPFVNTIADVTTLKNDQLIEKSLTEVMPGYLGAGSEFIFSNGLTFYDDGILDGDKIGIDPVEVGYIYGGIKSSAANIFWINTGAESEASNTIYKVSLSKTQLTSLDDKIKAFNLLIYPNPTSDFIRISLDLDKLKDIGISIVDVDGRVVHSEVISQSELVVGKNYIVLDKVKIDFGAYFYKFTIGEKQIVRKVIWSE